MSVVAHALDCGNAQPKPGPPCRYTIHGRLAVLSSPVGSAGLCCRREARAKSVSGGDVAGEDQSRGTSKWNSVTRILPARRLAVWRAWEAGGGADTGDSVGALGEDAGWGGHVCGALRWEERSNGCGTVGEGVLVGLLECELGLLAPQRGGHARNESK